jgi:hypothetical protein
MPKAAPGQRPLDEAGAGMAPVVAGAGAVALVAGAGGTDEAEAGAADRVGRNKGPFCPQPGSSTRQDSTDVAMMRRRPTDGLREKVATSICVAHELARAATGR